MALTVAFAGVVAVLRCWVGLAVGWSVPLVVAWWAIGGTTTSASATCT